MTLLAIKHLRFAWEENAPLLAIDAFELKRAEKVFLKGPSGCGKTTLLNLIGGVLAPQQGRIELLGQNLPTLSPSARDRFRADHLGFMFQQFNLLPFLSVEQNILLGCRFSTLREQRATHLYGSLRDCIHALLEALQLPSALFKKPAYTLSIGQQQRVAAARALLGAPELIIADEPTSALDADNRHAFLTLLFNQCHAQGSSLLLVSHDSSLANRFDRALSLPDLNQATPQGIV